MLRNLFASVLIMGSAVVLSAPDAKAQSVDLTFSGTLGTNCTFSAPTPGVLNFINGNTIGNSPLLGSASVTVSCSAPANLTISAPIQTTVLHSIPLIVVLQFIPHWVE